MMTGVVGGRFVVSSQVSTLASCWVVRRLAVGVERFARISHASAVCRVRAAAQGGMATRMFWLARANYASAATTSSRRVPREALTSTTSPAARWPRSQSTAASLSASATARPSCAVGDRPGGLADCDHGVNPDGGVLAADGAVLGLGDD